MRSLWQDLRYGVRMLRRGPGFTAVALITLMLGIGASTAIFSVVYAVLFRNLPYPQPERLVVLRERQLQGGEMSIAWPNFVDWRAQNRSFTAMAVYDQAHFDLSGVAQPTLLRGAEVTADFFSLLGARPQVGRTFSAADDHPGAQPVAVLSDGLWRRSFNADPAIIGKTIELTAKPYRVAGVLAPGFEFFRKPTDVYIPLGSLADEPAMQNRSRHGSLAAIARLREGVSLRAARADMDTLAAQLALAYPASNTGHGATVTPLYEKRLGLIAPALYTLFAAAGVVFLIVCVNLANLLLARAVDRRKELGIRASLGASRIRSVRQMVTEGIVLAVLGGGLGVALAAGVLPLLLSVAPASIPRLNEVRVDWSVFAIGFGASVLAGILFSLLPALQATKIDVQVTLKESSGAFTAGRSRNRLRALLLGAEVALAVVLAVASGLLVRSLAKALAVDPGFNPRNVLSLDILLLNPKYKATPQRLNFFHAALERLRALPGVRDAGAVMCPPLAGDCWDYWYTVSDRPVPSQGELPVSRFNQADPGYFRAMQIPLVEGREFTDQDNAQAASVAVVNQTFARLWWPHGGALGKRILYGEPQAQGERASYEIVGVVGDVRQDGLDVSPDPEVCLPIAQNAGDALVLVIRASGDPTAQATAAETAIHTIDRDLPVRIAPATRSMATALANREFATTLLGVFASVAVLLAIVGIYGVVSYNVAQRTHEIGIRMALGAQRRDVLGLVLWQGLAMALAGIAVGLAGAAAASRLVASQLFGVQALDPLTFFVVPALLTAAALLASYLPARRAVRVDPIVALHYE